MELAATHWREDVHLVIRLNDRIKFIGQVDRLTPIDKELHVRQKILVRIQQFLAHDWVLMYEH